jgi:ribosome-associated protein
MRGITADGIVVIKRNAIAARTRIARTLARLRLVEAAGTVQRARKATKPTRGSQRRVDSKVKRGGRPHAAG